MTKTSTINGSASATAPIRSELTDLLIDSVVLPRDPLARAAVIGNILGELCAAIERLLGADLTPAHVAGRGVASLRQLVAAGQDHQQRMKTLGPVVAAAGGRT
jgi:hypothetical protein